MAAHGPGHSRADLFLGRHWWGVPEFRCYNHAVILSHGPAFSGLKEE